MREPRRGRRALTKATATPSRASVSSSRNAAISCATSRNVVGSSSTSAPPPRASTPCARRAIRTRCHSPPDSSSVRRLSVGMTSVRRAASSMRTTRRGSPKFRHADMQSRSACNHAPAGEAYRVLVTTATRRAAERRQGRDVGITDRDHSRRRECVRAGRARAACRCRSGPTSAVIRPGGAERDALHGIVRGAWGSVARRAS